MTMTSRADIFKALISERNYQDKRWAADITSTGGRHSVTEFFVYIRDYAEEALHFLTREANPEASAKGLHWARKVGALALACMEQHGAPQRSGFEVPAYLKIVESVDSAEAERG
jgi:hypothetical protein